MKKTFFFIALLFSTTFAQAQLLPKIIKKAEDKLIQKAEDAVDGKNKKPADKPSNQTGNVEGNDVQVNRKFDFVPGNKVIYGENFAGSEEGSPPKNWTFSGTAEVATLSKVPGKWLMLGKRVEAKKELQQALPENCTIEFDFFTSNLNCGWGNGGPSPDFIFTLGNDDANKVAFTSGFMKSRIYYSISGVNNTENFVDFNFVNFKTRPIQVRIAINKQRLRVWFDELKVVDLQDVVSPKTLRSGALKFYSDYADRESYPFISNIRIADAGLTERDLSIGGIADPKTTQTQTPATTKPQTNTTTSAPKTGTMAIKDFGTYHALLIAVEDYADPGVNKLDNPVKDALQLQKTLTTAYHFDPLNVKLLKNPSKKDVFTELARLRTAVKETDNLLVFYAGHGYWDTDMEKGYWLPTDAERNLPTNWIANEDVTGYIRAIKAKHTLLISDACFSGGIFKTREAFTGQRAVEEVYKMPSRKAITSGTLTVVPDKSVFIQYLIKKLEENKEKFLTEEQLFSQFKTAVMNNSPGQVPQFGTIINTGDEGGNFIFIRK